ncbi:MAG: hypothetical protein AAGA87_18055 [Pseudomonadota bacterium]
MTSIRYDDDKSVACGCGPAQQPPPLLDQPFLDVDALAPVLQATTRQVGGGDGLFEFNPTNPVALLAEAPSYLALKGYEGVFTRLPGYDAENGRSPYVSGAGPAQVVLDRVSPNAIDDFRGSAANLFTKANTIDGSLSLGPGGFDYDGAVSPKAERIFEGAGLDFLKDRDTALLSDDSWIEHVGSAKGIISLGQATHFEHTLDGINRQSSAMQLAQVSSGIGSVFDIRVPFTDHRIRVGGAKVGGLSVGQANSSTGFGVDAEDGVYGASIGLGGYLKGITGTDSTYVVLDTGLGIRFKGSATAHVSAFAVGADAMATAVWDDNTGTLSLEAAGGVAAKFGIKLDLAGEIQIQQFAGLVGNVESRVEEFQDTVVESVEYIEDLIRSAWGVPL